ncbi:alpha/beta hydrolase [Paraglaciecola aquimarina]|uniref:Alpha/beta hydrolase n=1 Tax=Paraglaciecola aquimarina TaxID=1235557 RepID=A0ABU3T1X4_9ALTE|nr:alpha/beta hydrolase [Paraglaciecola aquimarina]MDU0356274.1 alpha/beta hydrolase [Paraglaciecola aquimarina]
MATNLALSQPDKIEQLVLLSPAQTFTWLDFNMDIIENILFALDPQRDALSDILKTLSSNVQGIDQTYIDHFYRTVKTASISPLLMDMTPFTDEQLASLTMPILFLAGDQDLFNNQQSVDRAKSLLPCVQAEIVSDSGHFITVDQADLVNNKVIEFLNLAGHSKTTAC